LILVEISFENDTCGQEKSCETVQLVIQKLPLVHITVNKLDFSFAALIVAPRSREARMVNPRHSALSVTFTSLEVAFVGGILNNTIGANEGILVVHGSVTARVAILEGAAVLVAILEGDGAHIVEASIHELPRLDLASVALLSARKAQLLLLLRLGRVFGVFVLTLEKVAVLVLELNVAFCLILCEETAHFASVESEDPAAAHSAIILPLSLVEITIGVVVNARAVTHVVLHVAFVEFAIRHEDLDLAISDFVPIKSGLNNLVRQREENAVTKWLVIAPLALVDGTSLAEFAKACA